MEIRRDKVLQLIKQSEKPISATTLAKQFSVSRQIIVGDVALLRASGYDIIATPRGYIIPVEQKGIQRKIVVQHEKQDMEDELYTIVDMGGKVLDVIVEHSIYGQIQGILDLKSRYDVDSFIENVKQHQAKPLSDLTFGIHIHTIECEDEQIYQNILDALKQKGYLYEK